jgi:hypothetical protein
MSCGVVAPKDSDKKCWQWTCMAFEISRNSFFNPRHLFLFLSLLATSFSNINIDTDIIFITKFHRILQPHAPPGTLSLQSQLNCLGYILIISRKDYIRDRLFLGCKHLTNIPFFKFANKGKISRYKINK